MSDCSDRRQTSFDLYNLTKSSLKVELDRKVEGVICFSSRIYDFVSTHGSEQFRAVRTWEGEDKRKVLEFLGILLLNF